MTSRQTQWASLALCAAAFLVSLVLYGDLPERMPVHFGLDGEPDRWGSRLEGAFLLPAIATLVWLLLWALPGISPAGFRMEGFRRVYDRVQVGVLVFMLALHLLLVGRALGWWSTGLDRGVLVVVGLLFAFLGNYLGKTTRNFFLGIRTPWTLASDEVWARTHRLGGRLMVGAGLVVAGLGLIGLPAALLPWLVVVLVGATALVPVVYSYLLYRELEGFRPDPPAE